MTKEETRVRRGIAKLLLKKPFYGSILLQLKLIEDKKGILLPFPTFGTDGRRLIFNAEFSKSLTSEELQTVLSHEATHVAALHPLRRGVREAFKWNIATDHEVNYILETCEGLTMLEDSVPGIEGTAEKHYERMKQNEKECPCGCKGEGAGGEEESKHNGWKCSLLPPKLKPGESIEDVAAEIKENVRQAVTQAKMWGEVPSGLEKILEDLLVPKMKWDEILRRFIETHYESKVDWASPNRRYLHRGIILPGMGRKRVLAEIALAVDTSGSISEKELLQACTEVRAILEDCYESHVQLPLIWFDAAYYLDFIGIDDEFIPKGGGGTDFSVVMQCFKEEDLDQSGLVVITDGYCESYGEEPSVPVLWIVFGDYADSFSPPYGEVVKLELEDG